MYAGGVMPLLGFHDPGSARLLSAYIGYIEHDTIVMMIVPL